MSGITILPFSSLVIWINLLLSKILYNLNVENYKDYIKYFIFSPLLTNIFIIIFPVLGFDNKIWLTTILINLLLIAIFSLIYILLYLRGLKQYIGGTLFTIYIMLFVFFFTFISMDYVIVIFFEWSYFIVLLVLVFYLAYVMDNKLPLVLLILYIIFYLLLIISSLGSNFDYELLNFPRKILVGILIILYIQTILLCNIKNMVMMIINYIISGA
ncbi:MAG: hypothetical protein N3A71_01805 [Candidatus Dojkabacteria bacterium]|nr:hypothetical protein [Candidatus Dojkabacteria bacterium]